MLLCHWNFAKSLRRSFEITPLSMVLLVFHSTTSNNNVPLTSWLGIIHSLEMTPNHRSHMSSYCSSTVSMALSCIVSKIKQDTGWIFISHLHLTPPLRRPRQNIVSKIKQDTGWIFISHLHLTPPLRRPRQNFRQCFVRNCGASEGKQVWASVCLFRHETWMWPTDEQTLHAATRKTYSTQGSGEWCLRQVSKSMLGLVWHRSPFKVSCSQHW